MRFMLLTLLSVVVLDVDLAFRSVLSHYLSNLFLLVGFEIVEFHGEGFEASLSGEKSEKRRHALVLIPSKPIELL